MNPEQFARELEAIRKRLCDLVGPLGWKVRVVCRPSSLLSLYTIATFYVSRVIQLSGHPLDGQKVQQSFTVSEDQLIWMGADRRAGLWSRQLVVDVLKLIEQSIIATPDAVISGGAP